MCLQLYIRRDEAWLQHHERRSVREGLYEKCVFRLDLLRVECLCFGWNLVLVCTVDDSAKGIVEMLFCTSLVALVGVADQPQSSPRKLQIVNTKVRWQRSYIRLGDADGWCSWTGLDREGR